ncbi:hypothetical protein LINGRAHAP2_LOCUS6776, partial [Linum grandiflorum]
FNGSYLIVVGLWRLIRQLYPSYREIPILPGSWAPRSVWSFWPLPKPLYALHHELARQLKLRPREFTVSEAGHGLIQFIFTAEEARAMVLQNQPWCYKRHIINLIPWEFPSQLVFDRLQVMALTVRLLDLPPFCTTTEFGKDIMEPVGEVVSADLYTERPNGAGRPFIKVIVRMDLLASFPGKVEAVIPREPAFDVLLGFEGLPSVCFLCGLLGHTQRSCDHADLISPTLGLRGMWMITKPSGFLLEDLGAPLPSPPRRSSPAQHPRARHPPSDRGGSAVKPSTLGPSTVSSTAPPEGSSAAVPLIN